MRVRSRAAHGVLIDERVLFSVGGGFVVTADELDALKPAPGPDTEPYPFTTASRLPALCAEHGLSIEQVVLATRRAAPEADVRKPRWPPGG